MVKVTGRALDIVQNLTVLGEEQKKGLAASIYHQLGMVAQAQREFSEARKNYNKALELKIEFDDRYLQAKTYHQLGMVAEEQREFEEARKNYNKALAIFIEFDDRYAQEIVLGSLKRLEDQNK